MTMIISRVVAERIPIEAKIIVGVESAVNSGRYAMMSSKTVMREAK